jgi:hypothetical protein
MGWFFVMVALGGAVVVAAALFADDLPSRLGGEAPVVAGAALITFGFAGVVAATAGVDDVTSVASAAAAGFTVALGVVAVRARRRQPAAEVADRGELVGLAATVVVAAHPDEPGEVTLRYRNAPLTLTAHTVWHLEVGAGVRIVAVDPVVLVEPVAAPR